MPSNILIVDDDAAVRESLKQVLEEVGHEVSLASDGKQALEILRGAPPDLMLLDLVLPDTDGLSLLEEMERRNLPSLPVVLLITAYPNPGGLRTISGAAGALRKPIHIPDLLESIRVLLSIPSNDGDGPVSVE